jgi:hypothetical protein
VGELEGKLTEGSITPIEANMAMRQLQQELMRRRMEKVVKQVEEQKGEKGGKGEKGKEEE